MPAAFSSTTIQPDVPQGRISPNASPHVRATNDLYATEQRLGGRLESATKAGGFLNIDSCKRPVDSVGRDLAPSLT